MGTSCGWGRLDVHSRAHKDACVRHMITRHRRDRVLGRNVVFIGKEAAKLYDKVYSAEVYDPGTNKMRFVVPDLCDVPIMNLRIWFEFMLAARGMKQPTPLRACNTTCTCDPSTSLLQSNPPKLFNLSLLQDWSLRV